MLLIEGEPTIHMKMKHVCRDTRKKEKTRRRGRVWDQIESRNKRSLKNHKKENPNNGKRMKNLNTFLLQSLSEKAGLMPESIQHHERDKHWNFTHWTAHYFDEGFLIMMRISTVAHWPRTK